MAGTSSSNDVSEWESSEQSSRALLAVPVSVNQHRKTRNKRDKPSVSIEDEYSET
jgi:hypothetical protein